MGSMQFWPRKRAKRIYARVRSFPGAKETKLLAFAGYKVGMTHLIIVDNRAQSDTKGEEITCPVTVVECPPLKTASIRFYKKTLDGLHLVSEVPSENVDKELGRTVCIPKKIKKKVEDIKEFDIIKVVVYTKPAVSGVGKKKPELFEVAVGGTKEEALKWAQENLGKEIAVKDVFKEGQQVDIHSISIGHGYKGATKRFGVSYRSHKSEKGYKGPGSLGAWRGQGHMMYRVAHPGQTGYHQRTELNKLLLKIGNKDEINPKGGFMHYGLLKSSYILLKGSIAGAKKRLIIMTHASRPNHITPTEAPSIKYVHIQK